MEPDDAPRPFEPAGNPRRKAALLGIAGVVVLAAIAYGAYWALVLNHYESTDNAYVQGNVVQLTPQIGGTVIAINVDDTDHVKAGQLLVKLDPADAQVALDQAEAQLAQTVREVRTLFANNGMRRRSRSGRPDLAGAERPGAGRRTTSPGARPWSPPAVGGRSYHVTRSRVRRGLSAASRARRRPAAAAATSRSQRASRGSSPRIAAGRAKVREAIWRSRAERGRRSRLRRRRSVTRPGGLRRRCLGDRLRSLGRRNFKEGSCATSHRPASTGRRLHGKKSLSRGSRAGRAGALALMPAERHGNWIRWGARAGADRPRSEARGEHPLRIGCRWT